MKLPALILTAAFSSLVLVLANPIRVVQRDFPGAQTEILILGNVMSEMQDRVTDCSMWVYNGYPGLGYVNAVCPGYIGSKIDEGADLLNKANLQLKPAALTITEDETTSLLSQLEQPILYCKSNLNQLAEQVFFYDAAGSEILIQALNRMRAAVTNFMTEFQAKAPDTRNFKALIRVRTTLWISAIDTVVAIYSS